MPSERIRIRHVFHIDATWFYECTLGDLWEILRSDVWKTVSWCGKPLTVWLVLTHSAALVRGTGWDSVVAIGALFNCISKLALHKILKSVLELRRW